MYENELSEGMGSVKDFNNYGAHLYLTRAQAVAFLQRLSTKEVTTFRGIPSNVAPDEILGVVNPIYDGTKEEVIPTYTGAIYDKAKELAEEHGYKYDATLGGSVALRDKTTNRTIIQKTSDGYYESPNDKKDILYELLKVGENISDSTLAKVKKAVEENINKNRVTVNIDGKRYDINVNTISNKLVINTY